MKILFISDVHADARLFGVPRFDEMEVAMQDSVRVAVERRVDRYCFLGDLCDPDSGVSVFRCVELALRTAYALHRAHIPSTWLAGNHDVIEDGSGETTLTPLRALAGGGMGVRVHEVPGWDQWGAGLSMLALPYTATSESYDPEAFVERTWQQAGGGKVIVLTHLGIEGVQPGEETKDMPRGRDVLYPADAVARRAPLAQFAGHYHKRQVHKGIQIVGAPARFAFGEKDNDPGFLVCEI